MQAFFDFEAIFSYSRCIAMVNEHSVSPEQPRTIPVVRERLTVPEGIGVPEPEVKTQPQAAAAEHPTPVPIPAQPAAVPQTQKEPALVSVESVLADGLGDVYATLDPMTQREVRQQGETTAARVLSLLQQASVQVRKIIELITGWLKLIPGVSRLFIEQEAKLKTDRLLALRRKIRGEQ